MTQSEISVAQRLIDSLSLGEKKCLKEIYGDEWGEIASPKHFGKIFKKAVRSGQLTKIKCNGIRESGRCDEYERIN